VTSVTIPPTVSFIDSEAFKINCEISVSECDSCIELAHWSARQSRSDSDSARDFRRALRLGSELPVLADSLVDLSQFEAVRGVGVIGQGSDSAVLYVRRSDCIHFVVELICRFESGNQEVVQQKIETMIEKRLNLRHRCIAAPIGFAVSGGDDGDATELRAVRPFAEGGSLAEVLARPPPQWTATAKAIAVAGLALGLRFANGVRQPHGRLRPDCVLFDGAARIQTARIGAESAASEIESRIVGDHRR
jgi:hypothetical protein